MLAVFAGGLYFVLQGLNKPPATQETKPTALQNVGTFKDQPALDMSQHMPPDDIMGNGGLGLQLYGEDGKFVPGDKVLDFSKNQKYYLTLFWLEDREGDLTAMVTGDGRLLPFSVDGGAQAQQYSFHMKPKTNISIPITLAPGADKPEKIIFSCMYDNSFDEKATAAKLPTSAITLTYTCSYGAAQGTDSPTKIISADQFRPQTEQNEQAVTSEGFYCGFATQPDTDFIFTSRQTEMPVGAEIYLCAMGKQGDYRTTVLLLREGKIIASTRLDYTLGDQQYLVEKLSFDGQTPASGDQFVTLTPTGDIQHVGGVNLTAAN